MTELDPIRAELQSRLATLQSRLHDMEANIQRRDGPLSADSEEQATELENVEVLDRLDESTRDEITLIQAALRRLEEGTYGTCADCGGEIGGQRLAAIPEARDCIVCAERGA